MLDRALKLVIVLVLLPFLVQCVIGLLARVLEAALPSSASVLGSAGSLVGWLLVDAMAVFFLVGMFVRFVQWVQDKTSRQLRRSQGEHDWAGRAFADEVPVDRIGARPTRSHRRRRG